jgi:hypothetical protein
LFAAFLQLIDDAENPLLKAQKLLEQRSPSPSIANDIHDFVYQPAPVPRDFTKLLGIGEERYCRYAWSKHINPNRDPKKESAWQAIGCRQSGKPVTDLLTFKLAAEGYVSALSDRVCSLDVFLSPNQFYDWRNTKQLAQLHANWLDVDTEGHEVLSLAEQKIIFNDLVRIIKENDLPPPTAFVASGSGGFHIYWIYDGEPAYKWRIRIWREITLVLAKVLKRNKPKDARWKVDFAASRDPSRVLRLPGTYHGKSGRVAKALIGGPSYCFYDLAKRLISSKQNLHALDSLSNDSTIHFLPAKKLNVPAKDRAHTPHSLSENLQRHTLSSWWFRIY